MQKLLTTAQASAIYRAMTEANNIGARLHARIDIESGQHEGYTLHIDEYETGTISVFVASVDCSIVIGNTEQYANQSHFAQSYGIE